MKCWVVLPLLMAAKALAATAFVSDELVLGVYAEQNGQGQRLTTLHSGASVETLNVNGESTQVRLNDGTTGWVKSVYLTTRVPAVVRIKQLQEELDQSRATTPALAEAAARSEAEQVKRELASMRAASAATVATAPSAGTPPGAAVPGGVGGPGSLVAAILGGLGCGFWLGYATLARRIKHKFGGLKVY